MYAKSCRSSLVLFHIGMQTFFEVPTEL